MKQTFLLLAFIFIFCFQKEVNAQDSKIIYLHHSTGGLIFKDGNMAETFKAYNKKNGTNYSITERSFPNKPYEWANYPYDYWNIWVNGYCKSQKNTETYPNVECLESLCDEYDVIVLKHCYPGADILEDTGTPDISSPRKSLENYKVQYRALRDKFEEFPRNDFVVWTLVPRHRLDANSPANAGRAKEFVDWVKNEWLKENGKTYPNIHVFDYFSLAAEMDTKTKAPRVTYCLKYEYERSHEDSDSHPNELASQAIGPKLSDFLIDVVKKR